MTNTEKKLLVVDDDMHLRKMIRTYAELAEFICFEAESGIKAMEFLKHTQVDIIVLDVMMPGIDGFEVLSRIREKSQVPVIMLTARSEEYDKLRGFNLGVDDYVEKPFSPKELMARVHAVLKRSGKIPASVYRFGSVCIEPERRRVLVDETEVNLPPKEYNLLMKLAENEGIVLTRERLLESVWGYDYYGDARTLDTHIKSLREHLGSHRNLIKTVWGVGYKLENTQGQ